MNRISKREARNRFNVGLPVLIGGTDVKGEGAYWNITQFSDVVTDDFDAICEYFERIYCRGVGRILYPMFFITA